MQFHTKIEQKAGRSGMIIQNTGIGGIKRDLPCAFGHQDIAILYSLAWSGPNHPRGANKLANSWIFNNSAVDLSHFKCILHGL